MDFRWGKGALRAVATAGSSANLAAIPARFYRPLTISGHAQVMRVNGPNGTAVASASSTTRRAGASGGGFTLSESNESQTASPAISLRSVGGIDALIALQGIEDPVERRRRAVKHGRRALDALDALKLALLSGTLESGALLRLKAVAADLQDGSGDEKLDQVLAEIELRVAVELAKAGVN
jgi:Class II flagellar assembly regulator